MDSNWAFCLTSSREDVIQAFRANLAARIPGVTFVEEQDPEVFFPDAETAIDRKKKDWSQISYYVTEHVGWICFSYATGGEPFELEEPRAVSLEASIAVLDLRVDEIQGVRLRAFHNGREALSIDGAGAALIEGQDADEANVAKLVENLFGPKAPEDLLAALGASGRVNVEAITSSLGLTAPNEDLEHFEPEDALPEGHIVAFTRKA